MARISFTFGSAVDLSSDTRRNSSTLSSAIQSLSSGQQSISAGSDQLVTQLNNDAAIYRQSSRNTQLGTSLLSVATVAADAATSILARIGELANQAANGAATSDQRTALDTEAQALRTEYQRVVSSASFNGQAIFAATANFQVQGGKGDDARIALSTGTAPAATSLYGEHVDVTTTGGYPGIISNLMDATPDGRYVLFTSSSTEMVASDTNGIVDIFLRDIVLNTTERVNVSTAGVEANVNTVFQNAKISDDGRYVSFRSSATNLVAGDTNGQDDIFVRDRQLNTTTRVSVSTAGVESNGSNQIGDISGNGRYVTFASNATNLVAGDTNASFDIFVRDLQLNTTTRVSLTDADTEITTGAFALATNAGTTISSDGRYVVFATNNSSVVAGDTNGATDAFIRDTVSGTTVLVSRNTAGTQATSTSDSVVVSDDGRYVAFQSGATNLDAGDTNGISDYFVRDTQLNTLLTATSSSGGVVSNGGIGSYFAFTPDSGSILYFNNGTNLVAGDTNGVSDVFRKNLSTQETTRISLSPTGAQLNQNTVIGLLTTNLSTVILGTNDPSIGLGDSGISRNIFSFAVSDGTQSSTGYYLPTLQAISLTSQVAAQSALTTIESTQDALAAARGNISASLAVTSTHGQLLTVGADRLQSAAETSGSANILDAATALVRGTALGSAQDTVVGAASAAKRSFLKLFA